MICLCLRVENFGKEIKLDLDTSFEVGNFRNSIRTSDGHNFLQTVESPEASAMGLGWRFIGALMFGIKAQIQKTESL